ncbi:MAG: metallophosphatase family protein [Bacteroides sp.]|nr:metallophosphatase family protein [Ruminococcus flavefaciens]MCM1555763.1 metallophosphatase family protein [Bacteroides sp.]
MEKVGILSDTHGVFLPQVRRFLEPCAEIWHAGDIGSLALWQEISSFRPTVAVYGNIDDYVLRRHVPEIAVFECQGCKVVLTHIGGYPGKYYPDVKKILLREKPDIFVCGHSHILKVIRDEKLNLLHINPGAAGNKGFHPVVTALRMDIDGKNCANLEIFELDRNEIL